MKKNWKNMLYIALALALVISAINVPSSLAANVDGSTVTFEKQLEVDHWNSIDIPDLTFTFYIAPGAAVAATSSTKEVHAGVGSPSIGTAVFTDADVEAASGNPKKFVSIDFSGVTFPEPGFYRYIVTEAESSGVEALNGAVDYDYDHDRTRTLDIMVINDESNPGQLKINAAIMHTRGANADSAGVDSIDASTKIDFFKNKLETHNLEVKKTVTGNSGDRNEDFTIEITLTNCPTTGSFEIVKTLQDGTTTQNPENYSGATTVVTVQLKHNESVVLHGLPRTVHYKVEEKLTDAQKNEGYEGTYGGQNDKDMTADLTVSITNNKDVNTPTGLFLDYAPYALIVLVALGACVLFLRKRNTRDER